MYGVLPVSLASSATRTVVVMGSRSALTAERQLVGTAEPVGPGSSSGSGGSAIAARQ